jgi:hypothetical protein
VQWVAIRATFVERKVLNVKCGTYSYLVAHYLGYIRIVLYRKKRTELFCSTIYIF